MIAGNAYKGLRVDIWSCGVILYAILCGYLPFEDQNTKLLYKKILNGQFEIPVIVKNQAKDLMLKILNTEPSTRYTIDQIKAHPWYKKSGVTQE